MRGGVSSRSGARVSKMLDDAITILRRFNLPTLKFIRKEGGPCGSVGEIYDDK